MLAHYSGGWRMSWHPSILLPRCMSCAARHSERIWRKNALGTHDVSVKIDQIAVSAYKIPTDYPEADGTLSWDSTTIIIVEASGGGKRGLGYTYGEAAVATLIKGKLASVVEGQNAMSIPGVWAAMVHAIRNNGRPGICSMAISAIDTALWDLKARILDIPLVTLFGAVRDGTPVYGSGGFTSYPIERLQEQLAGWVARGIPRVKMKIGTHPEEDPKRVRAAREAIGPDVELFVDANGAYSRKQALAMADIFQEYGVTWFEEPVSSDDLQGLHLIRDRGPAGMNIAAGEYGYDLWYFRRMLDAGAVDVLQADVTRCGGFTGFLGASALTESHSMPLSGHTAPSLHAHVCCAVRLFRPLEFFHDHDRIEHMIFDGVLDPIGGTLNPDLSRPGMGLELKRADAERYAV
jgi:L-alanine-DL-glutamate epimerase-like enolase superfamily enzyme